jgi:anaerobic magnesium-protoporphyrin IX monomethyl ester cyclase
MVKVMLIDPGGSFMEDGLGDVLDMPRITPLLGLAYIGTVLAGRGHCVKVLDACAYRLKASDIEEAMREFKPRIVGLSAKTFNVPDAFEAAHIAKSADPGVVVVLGGAHATARPDETLRECADIDVVVRGEGEATFEEIAARVGGSGSLDGVAGITYRRGVDIVRNPDRPLLEDLDGLPYPDWGLYEYGRYGKIYSGRFGRMMRVYPVSGSRGCPFACDFCYPLFGRRIRRRTPENVYGEIERDFRLYGARCFDFTDAFFASDREWVMRLCRLIVEGGLAGRIGWSFENRVDFVDEGLLKAVREAGCHLIFYGIESGDDGLLKSMNKGISTGQIYDAVKKTRDAGISVLGNFMMGHPLETRESLERTVRFAERLRRELKANMYFSFINFYPGTGIERMVEEGVNGARRLHKPCEWGRFTRSRPMVVTGNFSEDDLFRSYAQMLRLYNIPIEGPYDRLSRISHTAVYDFSRSPAKALGKYSKILKRRLSASGGVGAT